MPEPDAIAPAAPSTSSARIYDSVRSAHLERFRRMTPADNFFTARRYDFDPGSAGEHLRLRRVGRLSMVRILLTRSYDAVEVSEPMMVSRWLDLALQLAAIRLRGAVTRRPTRVGAYCIGLTDPVERLHTQRHLPRALGRPWSRMVIAGLVARMDRLAFGTDAARDLLSHYAGAEQVAARARLYPAVPAACDCPIEAARDPQAVLFVGRFVERKGIDELLAAWDELPSDAGLNLTLVGSGPLLERVRSWTDQRPATTLIVDPPRAVIHDQLRRAHVLVLLSQRAGYWREQVGLPITEGLSHGCEVVASDETGLAPWLTQHGHTVVPARAGAAETAQALVHAAAATRSAGDILADLPAEDPRMLADAWLLSGADDASAGPRPSWGRSAQLYLGTARRSVRRYGFHPGRAMARADDRPVFVVGSPRSGTTFIAEMIGSVPGFADLGELRRWKSAIPALATGPEADAARAVRTILRRAQRISLLAGLRGIEQTPESTFLIPAIAAAFPGARFIHMVRDGRDVAASLIGLGWLAPSPQESADEVGHRFGADTRFWVEPERREQFGDATEAVRAAWVWRRYELVAREMQDRFADRFVEVRYEDMVSRPDDTAARLAEVLDARDRTADFAAALGHVRASAIGRWRTQLREDQVADVTHEAGELLGRLGYTD